MLLLRLSLYRINNSCFCSGLLAPENFARSFDWMKIEARAILINFPWKVLGKDRTLDSETYFTREIFFFVRMLTRNKIIILGEEGSRQDKCPILCFRMNLSVNYSFSGNRNGDLSDLRCLFYHFIHSQLSLSFPLPGITVL